MNRTHYEPNPYPLILLLVLLAFVIAYLAVSSQATGSSEPQRITTPAPGVTRG